MAKDNNRSCGENSSLWAIFFYDRMFASGICPKALEYNHTDIWLWLGNIEEVMPGSWDMQMISGMKADPKCREFVSEKDVMEELGCILREMSLFQRI